MTDKCKHEWRFHGVPNSPYAHYIGCTKVGCNERLRFDPAEAMLNAHASLTEKVGKLEGLQNMRNELPTVLGSDHPFDIVAWFFERIDALLEGSE